MAPSVSKDREEELGPDPSAILNHHGPAEALASDTELGSLWHTFPLLLIPLRGGNVEHKHRADSSSLPEGLHLSLLSLLCWQLQNMPCLGTVVYLA